LRLCLAVVLLASCAPPGAPRDPETSGARRAPAKQVVRFVALGDAGNGNEAQYQVSAAIEQVCAQQGCDFALYLGDNVYASGPNTIDDVQFEEKFEAPYANLSFPFFAVLGNHDFGGGGGGYDLWRAELEVEYTDYSEKWTMPDRYYAFVAEHVQFLGLDTTSLMFGYTADQRQFLFDEIASTPATWRVAYGHHPYRSNGSHGDAGSYEEIPESMPGSEVARGEYVREFMERSICGQVDVYLCGHDHNRQWLASPCETELIVSGSGSNVTGLEGSSNFEQFADDTEEGFFWFEIADDQLTGASYDLWGNLEYVQILEKAR
jgi:hypothetical protein